VEGPRLGWGLGCGAGQEGFEGLGLLWARGLDGSLGGGLSGGLDGDLGGSLWARRAGSWQEVNFVLV